MNMKDEHTILSTLKRAHLTEDERERLTLRLTQYRLEKPVPPILTSPTVSPLSLFSFSRPMPVFASLLLVLVIGSSVAQAAEGSVPGDVLYPIKTAVTEPVREVLALNVETKVAVDAWKAERRLEEAQTLALRADASEERKERLEENFSRHALRVEERLEDISMNDPALAADLAAKFEASLAAHDTLLASLEERAEEKKLRTKVKEKLVTIGKVRRAAVRETLGDNTNASPVAAKTSATLMIAEDSARIALPAVSPAAPSEALMKAVDRARESASRALIDATNRAEGKRSDLSVEAAARVDTALAEATAQYADAEALVAGSSYGEAFEVYQRVLVSMNTLIILLKSDINTVSRVPIIEINGPMVESPLRIDIHEVDDTIDDYKTFE